jgi:SAM-dependent methyltransferase
MNALACTAYVRLDGKAYALTERGRRWMTGLNRGGFADYVNAGALEIAVQAELGDFLESDAPVSAAKTPSAEQWRLYLQGERASAKAREAAVLAGVPVPAGAKSLLDIGAAHGQRAAAFCAKHPGLSATVLDLPEAIEAGAPLLAEATKALGVLERVSTRAADPRTADLGEATQDVILVSTSLVRPSAKDVAGLIERCARALRPGGLLVFDDFFRPSPGSDAGQQALLHVLLLSMKGEEGPFTAEEIAGWQRAAGLTPLPKVSTAGHMSGLQMARKAEVSR